LFPGGLIPRIEKHQAAALLVFALVVTWTSARDGINAALPGHVLLAVFLVPVLSYRLIAWLSGFGFPEYFARDFSSDNHPGPYAFFFWILFLIACAFRVLGWQLLQASRL